MSTTPIKPLPKSLSKTSVYHGSVVVHGRAVLARCRPEYPPVKREDGTIDSKPLSLLLDVNFVLIDNEKQTADPIAGICSFFNEEGFEFSEDDDCRDVVDISAHITLLPSGTSTDVQSRILPDGIDLNQYSFIGTITRMDYIGAMKRDPDTKKFKPDGRFDVMRRPIFTVASLTTEAVEEKDKEGFTVCPTPYIRLCKELDDAFHPSCTLKISYIGRSKRRWSTPIVPKINTYVAFAAFGMSVSKDAQGFTTAIHLDLDTITLQGRLSRPEVMKPTLQKTPSPAASGKRSAVFDYADSPAPAKRRRLGPSSSAESA